MQGRDEIRPKVKDNTETCQYDHQAADVTALVNIILGK